MRAVSMLDLVTGVAVVSAYAATVLQGTDGYKRTFFKARNRFADWCDDRAKKAMTLGDMRGYVRYDSLKVLKDCGWCLTPWIAGVVYIGAVLLLHPRCGWRRIVAGLPTSAALAAFVRHLADMY